MNKINIDGVLIVEGKTDVSYLSSFVNALFFITNGYDLDKEKIDFLKLASSKNKLIIFTDPDKAGEEIRKRIKTQINPVFEAKSDRNFKKISGKTGVAELKKEAVIAALEPYVTDQEVTRIDYELSTLISLSENPQETREIIINNYRLMKGNNKFLENQLNILKISRKELEDFVHGN